MTPERLRVLVLLISGAVAAAFLGTLGYVVLQPPPSAAPAANAAVSSVRAPPRADVTGVTAVASTAGARVAVKGGKSGGKKQRPWVADAFEKRRPGALAALARRANAGAKQGGLKPRPAARKAKKALRAPAAANRTKTRRSLGG